MIEINLLPEERRVKMRAAQAGPQDGKPAVPVSESLKKLVYLIPAAGACLVIAHAYMGFTQFSVSLRSGALEKKIQTYQPRMHDLAGFKSRFESLSQDAKIMQELSAQCGDWAKKLNRLSIDLPSGIWITDLTANPRQLVLKCSAVSLDGDQVELINRFLSALKEDPAFFSGFAGFDLGSVQKRFIGSYEVADFVVTLEVKSK